MEALRYKPVGRVFDCRCGYWNFSIDNPSGRTKNLGSHRNEYQGYLMVGKGGRCIRLTTLPLPCASFLEMLEPELSAARRCCSGLYWDIGMFSDSEDREADITSPIRICFTHMKRTKA